MKYSLPTAIGHLMRQLTNGINDKNVTKSEYQNQMSKMYTPESDWVFMQRRFDMNNSSIDYNIDNYR